MTWASWLARAGAPSATSAGLRRVAAAARPPPTTGRRPGRQRLPRPGPRPAVVAAAAEAARTWGAGAGASRLVTGTLDAARRARGRAGRRSPGSRRRWCISTGYHANLAAVTALADRDCLVVSDAHIHASLVDAVRLARAEVDGRARTTTSPRSRRPLGRRGRPARAGAGRVGLLGARRRGAARRAGRGVRRRTTPCWSSTRRTASGWPGPRPRAGPRLGLAGVPHVVVTATLSKALGAQGGAVLGSPAVVEHLVNRARPFIFDTGLAPAAAGAALAALRRRCASEPDLPAVVRERVARPGRRARRRAVGGRGAVGADAVAPGRGGRAGRRRATQGVRVGCFRPPSVPDGISRLRITTSAGRRRRRLGARGRGAGRRSSRNTRLTPRDGAGVVVVTGTSTGVGKTSRPPRWPSRAARRGGSVVVVKPVQTGVGPRGRARATPRRCTG